MTLARHKKNKASKIQAKKEGYPVKLITLGQPVVSKIDYCIVSQEIVWGYIVEADVNTGRGVILHAVDIGTDGQPVRIDVNLDQLVFIDVSRKPRLTKD
jgi:hypothetical protein